MTTKLVCERCQEQWNVPDKNYKAHILYLTHAKNQFCPECCPYCRQLSKYTISLNHQVDLDAQEHEKWTQKNTE